MVIVDLVIHQDVIGGTGHDNAVKVAVHVVALHEVFVAVFQVKTVPFIPANLVVGYQNVAAVVAKGDPVVFVVEYLVLGECAEIRSVYTDSIEAVFVKDVPYDYVVVTGSDDQQPFLSRAVDSVIQQDVSWCTVQADTVEAVIADLIF